MQPRERPPATWGKDFSKRGNDPAALQMQTIRSIPHGALTISPRSEAGTGIQDEGEIMGDQRHPVRMPYRAKGFPGPYLKT